MTDDARPAAEALVTGADIARLAGVTRAAVSNWRRRYADFPSPAGGGASSPLFSLAEVRAWLSRRQKGHEETDEVHLWQALRGAYGDDTIGGLAAVARFLARANPDDEDPDLDASVAEPAEKLAACASAAEVVQGLIERFLDFPRRSEADQVTPQRLIKAIRHFVDEEPLPSTATVFDPACGIGTLLCAVGPTGPGSGLSRRGQEADPGAARFAQLVADLSAHDDTAIETGDSLRHDRWPGLGADLVVCDPPAAVPDWGREELLLDARWELGTPSRAENELAWLQHCYAHTAPGGRVIIVMPTSVAYRKAGRRIRAELVRRGILTHVVALPAGMAATHALPVHLWQLRRPGPHVKAAAAVRMIDLSENDPSGPMEPRPEQIAEVPLIDLLDDTVDLAPRNHVRQLHRDHPAEYLAARQELERQARALLDQMPALDAGAGLAPLDSAAVSVAELVRAGLVELGDDLPFSTSDQLDTDYLHGFLRSPVNIRRSTSASGSYRLDVRGSRIPQMSVDEQRRYGAAFRSLQEFEQQAQAVAELAAQAVALAREGLTNGTLTPPASDVPTKPGN
ncbi:N-6 DNA methylase [Streptomyces sp. NPDC021212]|uniref:N-6 DNA methylase n=1 Tax=Streptomyces sp. NPDC021212 TaxID=3365118 RepID=UPI0037A37594